ncbi:4-oxalocrotonate tautomerase [Roseateles sp. YR242]|uniref:4-oxalocrotonate tautomerase n=1 Tax=Roseateles sp. YR242 TaxID=1855305 RepID=UPI0008C94B34|nr:4-oxalocrotonate tautomerase [Roseateles sp. YR242]SEK62107.1 4-oxalocrotonate tautomerase [Roseateles sp. YR242]
MPTLRVELFDGRTAEQKAELAKELTAACVRVLGGSPDGVDVLFFEVPREHWATGGVLWSEKGQ